MQSLRWAVHQTDIDELSDNALYSIKATDHNHHHGTNRLDSFSQYEDIDSASQLKDRVIVNPQGYGTKYGLWHPLTVRPLAGRVHAACIGPALYWSIF